MTTTTRGFRSLYLATNPADEHPGRRAPASSTPSSPPSATSPLPPSRHLVISAHGASTSVHHPSSDPDPSQIQPVAATINEPINLPASVHHAHARSRPITSVRPSPAADPPSFRPASGPSTAGTLISFHLHRRSATSLQQTTLHHAQSTTIHGHDRPISSAILTSTKPANEIPCPNPASPPPIFVRNPA